MSFQKTVQAARRLLRRARVGTSVAAIAVAVSALAGCGKRVIRLDFVPVEERLEPQVIETADADLFTTETVAMLTVSGLISNMKSGGMLSQGTNPVSDFRETLDAVARDPSVKAVVLRINSPGGTVTASDMMYKDVLAFKQKTGKPVVVCMMDLCASGGYYRPARPTTASPTPPPSPGRSASLSRRSTSTAPSGKSASPPRPSRAGRTRTWSRPSRSRPTRTPP
jgi:ClpP class serine protease